MSRKYVMNVLCGKYWLIWLLWILSIGICAGGSVAVAGSGGLSLESRVACQRAIEEVYWKHTIWPEENTTPKPPLSEVLSEDELRKKVTETLRMSKVLEEVWHHPVTGNDLQAEVERIAETTRDSRVLGELWSALGNDPQLIAECLARQTLVERLIHDWYAFDEQFHGRLKRQAMRKVESLGRIEDMKEMKGAYHEMEWQRGRNTEDTTKENRSGRGGVSPPGHIGENLEDNTKDNRSGDTLELSEDEWQEAIGRLSEIFGEEKGQIPLRRVSALQEDAERFYVMGVLRKGTDRLKVAVVEWRKTGFDKWWSRVRERFMPEVASEAFAYRLPEIVAAPLPYASAPNTWSPTAASQVPPRSGHTAVWTGAQMIIWGGYGGTTYGYQNNGARYNPSTNSWQQMSLAGAPTGRTGHSAVWTGTEMIIWGGNDSADNLNTGGRYNLSANTWTPTTTTGAPSGRRYHTAVWTGTQMIVWGGWNGSYLNTGGRYSPSANTWTSTATTGVPSARRYHTAVWTGTQMIVWGGWNGTTYFNTGGRYSPSTNTWAVTNTSGVPGARELHTAVWTGTEMIVWGGYNGGYLNTGGRYNPSANTWTPTLLSAVTPSGRARHTAVWATSTAQMIVWGGMNGLDSFFNTGGRYSPSTNSWISTAVTGAPIARHLHTAVWTNTEMIAWGGYGGSSYLNTGGRYNPSTNTWTPTSTTTLGAPGARYWHTAVWTGTHMVVWGGLNGTTYLNTGGLYSPSTNTWSATSITNAPTGRAWHTVVWTGTQMIVWGGVGITGNQYWNTGGRYNPSSNTWTPTATTGAPNSRRSHTAVWTGTHMIVWGGSTATSYLNTGGLYNPVSDTWAPTSASILSPRGGHAAVWAGGWMIVWGGAGSSGYVNTGGRYNPVSGQWIPTSTTGAPSARVYFTWVWTGTEMIIWGGQGFSSGSIWLYTGYRYNLSTNTWTPTITTGAPSGRQNHTAVWTGTQMIVWGGWNGTSYFNTGGRYNPSTNTWTPTDSIGAPSGRYGHTAVWTNTEMIVWGGWNGASSFNTGGLYTP